MRTSLLLVSLSSVGLALCACRPDVVATAPPARTAATAATAETPRPEVPMSLPHFQGRETAVLPSLRPADRDRGLTEASWSPDGRFLAVCCTSDASRHWLHIWDLAEGRMHGSVAHDSSGHGPPAVVWSARGTYFATSRYGLLNIWRTADLTRQYRADFPTIYVQHAFSPDERRLAWGHTYGGATIVDLPSGHALRTAQLHTAAANHGNHFSWSPDSRWLVVNSDYERAMLWNSDGATVSVLAEPWASHDLDLHWRADSSSVAMSNGLGALLVLQPDKGARLRLLRPDGGIDPHTPSYLPAALDPAGEALAAFAPDGSVEVWDLQSGSSRALFTATDTTLPWGRSLAYSEDGRLLAIASEGSIHVVEASSGRHVRVAPKPPAVGDDGAAVEGWHSDGLYVRTTEELRSWSPEVSKHWRIRMSAGVVARSPDDRMLAFARGDVVLVRKDSWQVLGLSVGSEGGRFVGVVRPQGSDLAAFANVDRAAPATPPQPGGPSIDFCDVRSSPSVRGLACSSDSIKDLAPLGQMRKLQTLQLQFGVVSALPTLPTLPNLQHLLLGQWIGVPSATTVDLRPLKRTPNLVSLEVLSSTIASLEPLVQLPRLQTLKLSTSAVGNIKTLAMLRWLVELHTPLHFAEPKLLTGLAQLRLLDLTHAQITDLEPLTTLQQLRFLSLRATAVTDVAQLAALPQLERLDLCDTKVKSVAPLIMLKRLRWLCYPKEHLPQEEIEALKSALPELRVVGW